MNHASCKICGCGNFVPESSGSEFCSICYHNHGAVVARGRKSIHSGVKKPKSMFNYKSEDLLRTEKAYCRELKFMNSDLVPFFTESFTEEMRTENKAIRCVASLFNSLVPILKFHEEFLLPILEEASNNPNPGSEFNNAVKNELKAFLVYLDYFKTYNSVVKYRKENKSLDQFLRKKKTRTLVIEGAPGQEETTHDVNLDMDSYLIKPTQRFCQYTIFFDDLVKTAPFGAKKDVFKRLRNDHNNISGRVNSFRETDESWNTLFIIQQQLEEQIMQPNRRHKLERSNVSMRELAVIDSIGTKLDVIQSLLHMSEVQPGHCNEKCSLFVFNDSVLVTSTQSSAVNTLLKMRMKTVLFCSHRNLAIRKIQNDGLILIGEGKAIYLRFEKEADRNTLFDTFSCEDRIEYGMLLDWVSARKKQDSLRIEYVQSRGNVEKWKEQVGKRRTISSVETFFLGDESCYSDVLKYFFEAMRVRSLVLKDVGYIREKIDVNGALDENIMTKSMLLLEYRLKKYITPFLNQSQVILNTLKEFVEKKGPKSIEKPTKSRFSASVVLMPLSLVGLGFSLLLKFIMPSMAPGGFVSLLVLLLMILLFLISYRTSLPDKTSSLRIIRNLYPLTAIWGSRNRPEIAQDFASIRKISRDLEQDLSNLSSLRDMLFKEIVNKDENSLTKPALDNFLYEIEKNLKNLKNLKTH